MIGIMLYLGRSFLIILRIQWGAWQQIQAYSTIPAKQIIPIASSFQGSAFTIVTIVKGSVFSNMSAAMVPILRAASSR